MGVDGSLSPMAAVSGRKSEAMTIRWLRKELIVGDVGEYVGNRMDSVVSDDAGDREGGREMGILRGEQYDERV